MRKRISNKEWENQIKSYYSTYSSMSIRDFCKENNLSPQQFHYHKKRISDSNNSSTTIFHSLKLKPETETLNKSNVTSEIKILIGNATIAIPVSESTLISAIIKDLAL